MREHDLQPPRRRRFIATTQSAHNLPVFPNLAREMVPDDPNRLWSGEITDGTVASGFVDVALVLDAWSRAWSASDRSVDRHAARPGHAHSGDCLATTAALVHLPHRPRIPVRLGALPWHLLAQFSLSDYPLRERAIELLHSLYAVFYGGRPHAVIHPSARCCETNAACTLVVKPLPG